MPIADQHKNFAYSTVATAPSPATTGTSLVVAAGEGARFPTPPFNATIWPASAIPTPANAEIVRVTAIATDTLTIRRAQEGSTARSVVIGDQIAATITARTLSEAEQDPRIVGSYVNDFLTGTLGGGLPSTSSGGAVLGTNGLPAGRVGGIVLRQGTAAGHYATVYVAGNEIDASFNNNGVSNEIEWALCPKSNFNNVTLRAGWCWNAAYSDPPDSGVYFEKLTADTNWFLVVRNSGAQTHVDTGVTASLDTWYVLRVRWDAPNSAVYWSINYAAESLYAGATTPRSSIQVVPFAHVYNSGIPATAADHQLDWVAVRVTSLAR